MSRRSTSKRTSETVDPLYNVFIGGSGNSYASTEALLAAQLVGVSAVDIQFFEIDVDNNIKCFIDISWSFQINAFNGNASECTYFIDVDGNCTSAGRDVFENNHLITHIYLPGATVFGCRCGQRGFNNMSNLQFLNTDNCNGYLGNDTMKNFDINLWKAPNMTSMTTNYSKCMENWLFVEKIYMPLLTTASDSYNYRYPKWFPNPKTNGIVWVSDSLATKVDRPAWSEIKLIHDVGETIRINGLDYVGVSGTPVNDGEWNVASGTNVTKTSSFVTAVKTDTRTGTQGAKCLASNYTLVNNPYCVIYSSVNGASEEVVEVETIVGTSTVYDPNLKNGVDVPMWLQTLRDFEGWEIRGKTTALPVSAPTNLRAENIGAQSFKVVFDEPTPNADGNDFYEIHLDDGTLEQTYFVHSANLKEAGYSINGLEHETSYDIKIRTCDSNYEVSDWTAPITVTTVKYNLFLGDCADIYTDASQVETAVGAPVYDYTVVGNDIKCRVNAVLDPTTGFDCKYYIDLDGWTNDVNGSAWRYKQIRSVIFGWDRLDSRNVISLSNYTFQNNSAIKYFRFPFALEVLTQAFRDNTSCTRYYLPRCIEWHSNTNNNSIFSSDMTGNKIYIEPSMMTINGGDVEPDLKHARDTLNATLVPVTSFEKPKPITDLVITDITDTTLKLTFTPPSSTNTLDFYEVWVDDGSNNPEQLYADFREIASSGSTITGLDASTTYDIYVVACDEFWNRSTHSNVVQITTTP